MIILGTSYSSTIPMLQGGAPKVYMRSIGGGGGSYWGRGIRISGSALTVGIGVIVGLYWGFIGIMELKMEATI